MHQEVIIIKTYLNCSYEEKDEVKQLGALFDFDGKKKKIETNTTSYWYITEKIDFHPFKKWLSEETYTELCKKNSLRPLTIDFINVFNDISKKTKVSPNLYTLEADVTSIINIPNQDFIIVFLIDNHNMNQQLRSKISKSLLTESNELLDKRIRITGNIDIYYKYAAFQLNAVNVEILGDCSRLTQIEEWASTYSHLFKSQKDQESFEFVFRKIGLISNETSQGYFDFMKNLKQRTIEKNNIIVCSITMNVENIINSIDSLQSQEDCDCICIIRGGGHPEELLSFSHPDLLWAISESEIPVITGVGHKSDYLLCDLVANYNAGTPTGAAEYLNRLSGRIYYQQKKDEYKKSSDSQKVKTAEILKYQQYLEDENDRLKEENSRLKEALAQTKQSLDKKENRGIIGRIFNW